MKAATLQESVVYYTGESVDRNNRVSGATFAVGSKTVQWRISGGCFTPQTKWKPSLEHCNMPLCHINGLWSPTLTYAVPLLCNIWILWITSTSGTVTIPVMTIWPSHHQLCTESNRNIGKWVLMMLLELPPGGDRSYLRYLQVLVRWRGWLSLAAWLAMIPTDFSSIDQGGTVQWPITYPWYFTGFYAGSIKSFFTACNLDIPAAGRWSFRWGLRTTTVITVWGAEHPLKPLCSHCEEIASEHHSRESSRRLGCRLICNSPFSKMIPAAYICKRKQRLGQQ